MGTEENSRKEKTKRDLEIDSTDNYNFCITRMENVNNTKLGAWFTFLRRLILLWFLHNK